MADTKIDWASSVPRFDLHQFVSRVKVVSAKTGIAWEDYGKGDRGPRMHVEKRGQNQNRRLPTPEWVMNTEELKQVVLFYAEKRCYLRTLSRTVPDDWSTEQRLECIQNAAILHGKATVGIISRCICLHKSWTDEEVLPLLRNKLEALIQNFDTDAMICERGLVGTALAVAWFYYRCRYNSVQVAEELKLKSPGVRQILARLNRAARELKEHIERNGQRQKLAKSPTREELACLAAGMSHAEYEFRREQIRAVIHDRPVAPRVELARNSMAYGSIDKTELFESVRTNRKATDVRWNTGTRRVELVRELVAAPACGPMCWPFIEILPGSHG